MIRFHITLVICVLAATLAVPGMASKPTASSAPKVKLETSAGAVVVELYPDKAPLTVKNYLEYVEAKHFDGLIFHRVIGGFMIQGGGFTPDFKPRQVRAPIQLEAKRGLSNQRGTLAMARTSQPNSATSQFFINLVDNAQLDAYGGGYAVFGKVVQGMEVVDAIAKVETRPQHGHRDAPVKPVVIKSARVIK
jgi:peptidyl-prolyl cis-trans isomerase A (cyclophilin A)